MIEIVWTYYSSLQVFQCMHRNCMKFTGTVLIAAFHSLDGGEHQEQRKRGAETVEQENSKLSYEKTRNILEILFYAKSFAL